MVATQGREEAAWWTKSYTLAYSYDGVFWKDYKEEEYVKVDTYCFDVLSEWNTTWIRLDTQPKAVAHFLKIGLQMAFEHGEWHIYILFGKSHAEALTNQNLMQFLRSTCQH